MVNLEVSFGNNSNCYRAEPWALAITYQKGWVAKSYSTLRMWSGGILFCIKYG